MILKSHRHHIWLYYCHIWWFPYILVTLDGSNIKLVVLISHMIAPLAQLVVPFFFFFLVTLDSSNITMVSTNVTFDSSFIYFLVTLDGTNTMFSLSLSLSLSHIYPSSHLCIWDILQFFEKIKFHILIKRYWIIWRYWIICPSLSTSPSNSLELVAQIVIVHQF